MFPLSPSRLGRTRFAVGITAVVAVATFAWLVAWALLPLILGWSPIAMSSGSMGPTIDTGDVIVAEPHDGTPLGPGTVVVYDDPAGAGLITHRIVAVSPSGDYVTRGDANGRIDSTPVPARSIDAVGRILVPFVGRPYVWAAGQQWPELIAAALALAGALWMSRWGLLARFDPWAAPPDANLAVASGGTTTTGHGSRPWTAAMVGAAVVMLASVMTGAGSGAAFAGATDGSGSAFVADDLAPPTGVSATGGTSITLDWTATPDTYATGHRVYRSTMPLGPYSQVAEITPRTTTTYVDNPAPGTYYYVVGAFYLGWDSPPSPEVSATVVSPDAWLALDGGVGHTCGARVDGSVWCWGRNDRGQVGKGAAGGDEDIPVLVVGVSDAVAVVAGASHSCAVTATALAWCWGDNGHGQLGDNTTTDRAAPVQVVGPGGAGSLTGVAAAAAGESHSCAITTDTTVWCWGRNDRGQLGDNTTTDSSTPVQVTGPGGVGVFTGAAEISAGLEHTCVTHTDTTVWCWGLNSDGQLGDTTTTDSASPVQVTGAGGVGTLTGASAIGAGGSHSCIVHTDTTVWCWGRNDRGQLGDNTTTNSAFPVQVTGPGGSSTLTGATTVAGGLKHSCIVHTDTTVWCWGDNAKGQLGDNTTTDSATPVHVVGPGGSGTLTGVTVGGTGHNHSCAALDTDTVWCWGLNSDAQLGDNTTTDTPAPVQAIGV